MGQKTAPVSTEGTSIRSMVTEVTTPNPSPPPRSAQNSSVLVSAVAGDDAAVGEDDRDGADQVGCESVFAAVEAFEEVADDGRVTSGD